MRLVVCVHLQEMIFLTSEGEIGSYWLLFRYLTWIYHRAYRSR